MGQLFIAACIHMHQTSTHWISRLIALITLERNNLLIGSSRSSTNVSLLIVKPRNCKMQIGALSRAFYNLGEFYRKSGLAYEPDSGLRADINLLQEMHVCTRQVTLPLTV